MFRIGLILTGLAMVLMLPQDRHAHAACSPASHHEVSVKMLFGDAQDYARQAARLLTDDPCLTSPERAFMNAWQELGPNDGTADDDRRLLELALPYAEAGLPVSQYVVAKTYESLAQTHKADPHDFFAWLILAAENGHAQSQYELASHLDSRELQGRHALAWYRKAADQGHAEAAETYASFAYYGGPDQRLDAIHYFEIAARNAGDTGQSAREVLCSLSRETPPTVIGLGRWCTPHSRPSAE